LILSNNNLDEKNLLLKIYLFNPCFYYNKSWLLKKSYFLRSKKNICQNVNVKRGGQNCNLSGSLFSKVYLNNFSGSFFSLLSLFKLNLIN